MPEGLEGYVPWLGDHRLEGALFPIIFNIWKIIFKVAVLFNLTGITSGLAYLFFESSLPHFERHLALIFRVIHCLILLLLGIFHWVPLAFAYLAHPRNPPGPLRVRAVLQFKHAALCFAVFGLITLVYCFWVYRTEYSPSYIHVVSGEGKSTASLGSPLHAWSTGRLPSLPESCTARVASQQGRLFTDTEVYHSQFTRAHAALEENCTDAGGGSCQGQPRTHIIPLTFAPELSDKFQHDPALCGQGFEGNADLYGLGVRLGIYLQWCSSLLANNLNLTKHGRALQKTYLVFSTAICLAAIIITTSGACVFAVEIEILYWVYWGGFMCVFVSTPYSDFACTLACTTWIEVDWTVAITYTTHWIMAYHGLWYIWHGYDQTLARMPCGTYHAFTGLVLKDPSGAFWVLRDWLTLLLWPFLVVLPFIFPWIALLMLPELHDAIKDSAVFNAVFPHCRRRRMERWRNDGIFTTPIFGYSFRDVGGWVVALGQGLMAISRKLRRMSMLPEGPRPGIYAVPAPDRHDPWYSRHLRTFASISSFALSVGAIEAILAWNQIQGVYSLGSTGQYMPLIIGTASFAAVCWALWNSEMVLSSPAF